jgi:hypothetical protein
MAASVDFDTRVEDWKQALRRADDANIVSLDIAAVFKTAK